MQLAEVQYEIQNVCKINSSYPFCLLFCSLWVFLYIFVNLRYYLYRQDENDKENRSNTTYYILNVVIRHPRNWYNL